MNLLIPHQSHFHIFQSHSLHFGCILGFRETTSTISQPWKVWIFGILAGAGSAKCVYISKCNFYFCVILILILLPPPPQLLQLPFIRFRTVSRVELQTNLRENYAKFCNHGEGPYKHFHMTLFWQYAINWRKLMVSRCDIETWTQMS